MLKFIDLQIKRKEALLVQPFNCELHAGALVMLTGANGAGKSTLLKTLVGLLPIRTGEILIQQRSIKQYNATERSHTLAYINSEKIEEAHIRIIDLVRLGRYPYIKVQNDQVKVEADILSVLKVLGMETIQEKYLNEVSDGELQKAAIARALVQDTPILVMDEPTAFLDYPSKKTLFELLKTMAIEKNKIIICATHDVELASQYGTQFWHLENSVISVSDKSMAWSSI
jgi:iron complex transport system ATP-binding protein